MSAGSSFNVNINTQAGLASPGGNASGASSAGFDAMGLVASAAAFTNPFTAALAVATQALSAMTSVVVAVDSALTDMAKTAKRYSPNVAVATSLANVANTLANLEQAQKIGPQLAGYVEARSEFSVTLKQIETLLAQDILPLATDMVRGVTGLLSFFKDLYESVSSAVNNWLSGLPVLAQNLMLNALSPTVALLRLIAQNTKPKSAAPQYFQMYQNWVNNPPQNPIAPPGVAPTPPPVGKP